MEWLKDKKNLPFVVAIAVFAIMVFGGVIAWEMGAFQPHQTQITTAPTNEMPGGMMPPGGMPPPGEHNMPVPSGEMPSGVMAGSGRGIGIPGSAESTPAVAVAVKPASTNPAVGPDPFYIPGGQKRQQQQLAAGVKLPVRDLIGPLNLFQIHPPTPPALPVLPNGSTENNPDPAANLRLEGIVTGSDGINAILEIGGQSQTVKPGDTLPDGSSVQNIQTTSITLRTTGGTVFSLPLSAGNPDQGTNNPYGQPQFNRGFGGRNTYNGQPQFDPQANGQ
ncbi:MAG: hypothetical protein ACRYFS_04810 [Janthinobacterium lividum]